MILRFFTKLLFEIMIDPLFVTSKCSPPVKEVTEKNTSLAYTLLVCNKLLRRECLWVLGNHLLFSRKT